MQAQPLPSLSELRRRYLYDPASGIISRRVTGGWRQIRQISNAGYIRFNHSGRSLLAHRVAWKLYHGVDPGPILDHIDRNRLNNKICNLREV
ncbi:HNH endonuclease signature motif containing protein, partial [Methylobacterium sp. sgz302003]